MLLQLPDHRQSESWDCGRTALRIICDFYSKPLPLLIANLSNAVSGLSPDALSAAFRSMGFKVMDGSWTVPLLKAVTKDGKPVVVLTQLDGVGHWQVCSGIYRGKVHLQCPEQGKVAVAVERFDKDWIDFHHLNGVFDRWGVLAYLED